MQALWKLVAATLLVSAIFCAHALAQANCGSLQERLLYNAGTEAEPNEFPWLGLLLDTRGGRSRNMHCNVIIVSTQDVLVPSGCLLPFNNRPAGAAVLLGIWDQRHNSSEEYICNNKGFCVPAPVQYQVAEIKMHPLADKDTGENDVALLRLATPIAMTQHIQPICLEPSRELSSLIDRRFVFAGFADVGPIKAKDDAMVTSRAVCNRVPVPPPDSQFCSLPVKRTVYYPGAAMTGLNIEQDVPRSFYLIGMLMQISMNNPLGLFVFIFQDLRKSRQWILDNIA